MEQENKNAPIKSKKGWPKGIRFSEEHKKKLSIIAKKTKRKPPSRKGAKLSSEHKKAISIANKGRSTWAKGLTKENDIRIRKKSDAAKGRIVKRAVRRKISRTILRLVQKNRWHSYKGGKTKVFAKIRQSIKMRLWREAIFNRDGWACVWCKAKNGMGKSITLNADHIKPFAYYPELRFDVNNGRTLCKECHMWKTRWDRKIYSNVV